MACGRRSDGEKVVLLGKRCLWMGGLESGGMWEREGRERRGEKQTTGLYILAWECVSLVGMPAPMEGVC